MTQPDLRSRRIAAAAAVRTDTDQATRREAERLRKSRFESSRQEGAKSGCVLEHILKVQRTGLARRVVRGWGRKRGVQDDADNQK